jgi:hypothetical protein
MDIPPSPLSKEDMEKFVNTAKLFSNNFDVLRNQIAKLQTISSITKSLSQQSELASRIFSTPEYRLLSVGLDRNVLYRNIVLQNKLANENFLNNINYIKQTFTSHVLTLSDFIHTSNLDAVNNLSKSYLSLTSEALSRASFNYTDHLLTQSKQLEEVSKIFYPLLQNQIKFINQETFANTNLFSKLITEYSKISIGSQIDLEKNRFNFQFKHETYIEEQQVAIKLKDGKVENDLIEFQDIQYNGQEYKILLVPNTKYSEFKNQYSSLSLEFNNTSLIISTATKETILFEEKDIKYSYNKTTKTISLGPYNHSLINREVGERQTRATKNFRFIHFVLDYTSSDVKETMWYFKNLEAEYEGNQYVDFNKNKRWKNAFDRTISFFPDAMKNLFVIGNDYIKLNAKYR